MDNSKQDISNADASNSKIPNDIPLITHGGFFRYIKQRNYERDNYVKRHIEKKGLFPINENTDDNT